ncbi:hypothetical protein AAE478_008868 [Parahypoxylon ruwenzoriense]
MPALSPALLLSTLASRNEPLDFNASSLASNVTGDGDVMRVVCAWPVSGQYGIGSRGLYYALVATCVLARKAEWLRNACLAAALIFPAIAAIHSIVLAALHIDGAVDMDVFGAFQFCSIGILAAPLTVRISRTYFNDPGRNIIFIWTGLILAGLLSLTVEFFRIAPIDCSRDDSGNPIPPNDFKHFPYEEAMCGLTCSIEQGPKSPIRQGSTSEIYVIPAPNILTFDAATLLAAACCIPAILSLASMWNKILEINWKSRFGIGNVDGDKEKLIEGTNGATVEKMSRVNTVVRLFLSTLEVPLFSAAVIAILIFGERNFFSPQVSHQTELMTSIVVDLEAVKEETAQKASVYNCNCSHHHFSNEQYSGLPIRPSAACSSSSEDGQSTDGGFFGSPPQGPTSSPAMEEVSGGIFTGSSHSLTTPGAAYLRPNFSIDGGGASTETASTANRSTVHDLGNRRKVAKSLMRISNYLGTAGHSQFDDSEFKHGKAVDFPEVPGEEQRNPDLPQIREQYNTHREENPNSSPSKRPSRSGSFTGSFASGISTEGSPTITRAISAHSLQSLRSRSPSPAPPTPGVPRSSTLPIGQDSLDLQGPSRGRPRQRRDTLEVPVLDHHGSSRPSQSSSPVTSVTTITNDQGSPAIVISPDPDTSNATEAEASALGPAVSTLSSGPPSLPPTTALPPPP